jgi:hypothetical protein
MGKTDFEFIEIPERFLPILGEPDPGTRMYRRFGTNDEYAAWWDAVCEICGEESSVSPGGVAMYAKVSRAGVHKRMKEGRITAFLYHVVKGVTWITKREILENTSPYIYIPGIECRRWADIVNNRLTRREAYLECVGDGDLRGDFLVRWRGRKVNGKAKE